MPTVFRQWQNGVSVKTIAFIFARGGSKGLPGKNIRLLCGKPLIAWSIEQARAVGRISQVIVSTDSEEIAKVARSWGADVPFIRPSELASDHSAEWLAWRHALDFVLTAHGALPDAMVSVPATAPLRASKDIEACLDEFEKGGADVVVTMTDAHRSPYFNMVKVAQDGSVGLVMPPSTAVVRRQDVPAVYDLTTVAYVARPQFVRNHNGMFDGVVRAVHVPHARAIDIDTLADFEYAEFLMKKNLQKESNGLD
jgi:CMP-N-acetylneuraminic acid synthetase